MIRDLGPVLRDLGGTSGVRSRVRVRDDVGVLARPARPPSTMTAMGELGSGLAALRLVAAAPRLLRVPRGVGHTVVDIPGWMAPEISGAPLRSYLRGLGHDARGWGFGTNTGDPHRDVRRLTRRVLELTLHHGSPVTLVGWSLGGVLAREVARREPQAVRRVITYGTPVVGGARFTAVARAYGAGDHDPAEDLTTRLDTASPIQVPLTAVFSRRDGVVAWQACIDRFSPQVEHLEVSSTHIGMGFDPDVWELVARRLGPDDAA